MEDSELIRDHIRRRLSRKELTEANKRLADSPSFKKLYDEEKTVARGIGLAERERLKALLQNESSSNRFYWVAAAGLVPLFLFAYILMTSSPNYEQLYADHFTVYGVYEFGESRSGNEEEKNSMDGFTAYQAGQYQKAYDQLVVLHSESPKDGYLLYQGICLLALDHTSEAIGTLSQIQDSSSKYYALSRWYQALALLKMKDEKGADIILKSLENVKGRIGKESTQLRREL